VSDHDDMSHAPAESNPGTTDVSGVDAARAEELLARAGTTDEVWADRPAGLEDAIVDAISDAVTTGTGTGGDRLVDTDRARRRPGTVTFWLSAAAALVVVAAGIVLLTRDGGAREVFALAGTETVPEASGEVEVWSTPSGLALTLDTSGLPAAPEGTYYEAWLSNGERRVSIGTFHARDGGHRIDLWCGVTDPAYDQMTITLEPLDDDNNSSGDAYLRGTIELGG